MSRTWARASRFTAVLSATKRSAARSTAVVETVWISEREREHGSGCALELIGHMQRGATAFAALSDLHALRAITELQRAGIAVPGEATVTGFDDLMTFRARCCNPIPRW